MTATNSRRSFWPLRRRALTHNTPLATSSQDAFWHGALRALAARVSVNGAVRTTLYAPVNLVKTLFRT